MTPSLGLIWGVTSFVAPVQVRAVGFGAQLAQRGTFGLVMRGELFEILHPFALARLIFGQEYYFRACDTTIQLCGEWILIEDRSPMRVPPVWVKNETMTRQIWDALVLAGAEIKAEVRNDAEAHPTNP
jgi:hypothetical protein